MSRPVMPAARRERLRALAQALGQAFMQGRLADDPSENDAPQTLDEARYVQDLMVDALGGPGAWKVSPMRPDRAPSCAPIPRGRILASPAVWQAPLATALQIETEVAVTLASDLTGAGAFTAADVRAAVAALHPALEVVSTRWRHKEQLPALCAAADLHDTAGLVLGPPTTAWQSLDLSRLRMDLTIDGRSVAEASTGPDMQQVIDSLVWLAHHTRDRGRPLRRGDAILTGARIQATQVPAGALAIARVQHLGEVALRA